MPKDVLGTPKKLVGEVSIEIREISLVRCPSPPTNSLDLGAGCQSGGIEDTNQGTKGRTSIVITQQST